MLAAVALTTAAPVPGPYAIYSRARSRWTEQTYPPFLSYTIAISAVERGESITNTYDSSAGTADDTIHVRATSREETAHPYVPQGVTLKTKVTISYAGKPVLGAAPTVDGGPSIIKVSKTIQVSKRQQYDILGVPLLSPAYSFGLGAEELPARSADAAPQSGLKTIASVRSAPRDYDVRYGGIEQAGGVACYHLLLSPRRDPSEFRLRELWIDPRDFTTRQALVQGNFTQGPGPKLPWLIRFTLDGGLMYIAAETALSPVSYLGHTYSSLNLSFTDIQPQATLNPMWQLTLFKTSGDVLKEP